MGGLGACTFHPSVPAVNSCKACLRPLCASCSRDAAGGIYCSTDAVALFGSVGASTGRMKTFSRDFATGATEPPSPPLRWASTLLLIYIVLLLLASAASIVLIVLIWSSQPTSSDFHAVILELVLLACLDVIVAIILLYARAAMRQGLRSGARLVAGISAATFFSDVLSISQGDTIAVLSGLIQGLLLLFLILGWNELKDVSDEPSVSEAEVPHTASIWFSYWRETIEIVAFILIVSTIAAIIGAG